MGHITYTLKLTAAEFTALGPNGEELKLILRTLQPGSQITLTGVVQEAFDGPFYGSWIDHFQVEVSGATAGDSEGQHFILTVPKEEFDA